MVNLSILNLKVVKELKADGHPVKLIADIPRAFSNNFKQFDATERHLFMSIF
jgi:hypothetical protein